MRQSANQFPDSTTLHVTFAYIVKACDEKYLPGMKSSEIEIVARKQCKSNFLLGQLTFGPEVIKLIPDNLLEK